MKKLILILIVFISSCDFRTEQDVMYSNINNYKKPVTIVSFSSGIYCGVTIRDGNGQLIYLPSCDFNSLQIGDTIVFSPSK